MDRSNAVGAIILGRIDDWRNILSVHQFFGRGFSSERTLAKGLRETSSNGSSTSGRSITGIRLCIRRTSALGSVVMIVKVLSTSPESKSRHESHSDGSGALVSAAQITHIVITHIVP
jgi:hypothetical protein